MRDNNNNKASDKLILILGISTENYSHLVGEFSKQYLERKGYNEIQSLIGLNQTVSFEKWWLNEVEKINELYISCISGTDNNNKTKNELMELYKTKLSAITNFIDGVFLMECLKEIDILNNLIAQH